MDEQRVAEEAVERKVDPAVAKLMAASVANYHAICGTGRADGRLAAEAAKLLAFATSLGFNEALYRGNAAITAKTVHRERKRVIQWVRQHKPKVHEAFLKAEKLQREHFASTQKPPTPDSTASPTPPSEA